VNVPRNLSLGQYLYRHLASFLPTDTSSLWFSLNGQPIKWNFPTGVLYSVAGPPIPSDALCVSLNFENFPGGKLLRCDSRNTASAFFCHSFKEAIFTATESLSFLEANPVNLIEQSVVDQDLTAFTASFEPWLALARSWIRWPIRVFVKASEKLVFVAVPKEEAVTVGAVMGRVGIECPETVDIQGIQIPVDAKVEDVFPLLVSPDGWLYLVPQVNL
jgi:hypothetical protein